MLNYHWFLGTSVCFFIDGSPKLFLKNIIYSTDDNISMIFISCFSDCSHNQINLVFFFFPLKLEHECLLAALYFIYTFLL